MRVLLAGATGYIGRSVLRELGQRNIEVIATARLESDLPNPLPSSARIIRSNILEDPKWAENIGHIDVVMSCLASRSGVPADAGRVDYEANARLLEVAERHQVRRFILLSAICVQKPRLAFQREKLRFEKLLLNSPVPATIVRPTVFFKSLVGQINRVKAGKPFLLFGSGELTASKPISDRDLAVFMVNQLRDSTSKNSTMPIGGPGPSITLMDQARLLCEIAGVPLKTRHVPPQIFDWFRWIMSPLELVSKRAQERAEFLRIAKYYATESMLCWDQDARRYSADKTPEFGADTLEAFYRRIFSGEEQVPDRGDHTLF